MLSTFISCTPHYHDIQEKRRTRIPRCEDSAAAMFPTSIFHRIEVVNKGGHEPKGVTLIHSNIVTSCRPERAATLPYFDRNIYDEWAEARQQPNIQRPERIH
jgi:hypothetical protein